jgi:hypothetical protein
LILNVLVAFVNHISHEVTRTQGITMFAIKF